MIFRRKLPVPKICSPFFLATRACHNEVSTRFLGSWSPRPFVAASCKSRPHVSMEQKPRSNEHLSRLSF